MLRLPATARPSDEATRIALRTVGLAERRLSGEDIRLCAGGPRNG